MESENKGHIRISGVNRNFGLSQLTNTVGVIQAEGEALQAEVLWGRQGERP